MTIIQAIIFGIIQGLTEFLPVSSSGHLVLFSRIFGVECNFVLFSVIMHVATLFAVVIYFHKDIWYLCKHPFGKDAKKLYLATIPTVAIALLFKDFVDSAFDGVLLPFCFMFTAVLLFVCQILCKKNNHNFVDQTTNNNGKDYEKYTDNKTAFFMGIAQGIAILPGISRSGATMCTGMMLGCDREQSARFSFLMSIPIIFASLCYEVFGIIKDGGANLVGFLPCALGFAFAFVVGFLSIALMLKAVKNMKLWWFSIYLVAVAVVSFFVL
jgi:undecaprenyl-diphosphatase